MLGILLLAKMIQAAPGISLLFLNLHIAISSWTEVFLEILDFCGS